MSSQLGKLEKPSADQFKEKRKLYLVPLVFAPREPDPDFADLYERYWREVREHLLKLEMSMGPIARVYHEAVWLAGQEGLDAAERVNERSASVARSKVEAGATFEALEDREPMVESIDWQRCLLLGLQSEKVAMQVESYYSEAERLRYEAMARRIDESLKPEEAGLLFISGDNRVSLPPDVRLFRVAPPALNDIHRWLRDEMARARKQAGEEPEQP